MVYVTTDTYTGDDLRLLRLSRRVRAVAVARAAGVSKQRIYNIESGHPTRTWQRRYLEALEIATRAR